MKNSRKWIIGLGLMSIFMLSLFNLTQGLENYNNLLYNYPISTHDYTDEHILLSEASQTNGYRNLFRNNVSIPYPSPSGTLLGFGQAIADGTSYSYEQYYLTNLDNLNTYKTDNPNGIYNATYSFTDDIIDSIPIGWTDTSGADCTVKTFLEIDNHNKIVELNDSGAGIYTLTQIIPTPQIDGIIEFWFYKESGTAELYIEFRDSVNGGGNVIRIDSNNNGKYEYYSGGWIEFAVGKYLDNTWTHLRIDFWHSTNKMDVYINEVKELNQGTMNGARPNLKYFKLREATNLLGKWYIDSVGYSWDSNYTIGDNLIENYDTSYNGYNTIFQKSKLCGDGDEALMWSNIYFNRTSVWLYSYQQLGNTAPEHRDISNNTVYHGLGINTLEIQIHTRFGIGNNGASNCFNKLVEFFINGSKINSFKFQQWTDGIDGIKCCIHVFYVVNSKYYDNYNLFYSTINLYGCRYLVGELSYIYDSFFTDIPSFIETITITDYNPLPTPTPSATFDVNWNYNSYEIKFDKNETITIGNWTLNYPLLTITPRVNNYGFDIIQWNPQEWGDWSWAWNWLRDALYLVVSFLANLVIVGFQGVIYSLTVAFNFIVIYLLVGLIGALFWNIILKYMVIAGLWMLWLIWIGVSALWNFLIIPFFEWFVEFGIPLILAVMILFLSFIITLIIWGATLCLGDWNSIYDNVNAMVINITDEILEWISIFIIYLPYFISWIVVYVILIGIIYVKFLYFKSKGWHENALEMKELFTTFTKPFTIIITLISYIIGGGKTVS